MGRASGRDASSDCPEQRSSDAPGEGNTEGARSHRIRDAQGCPTCGDPVGGAGRGQCRLGSPGVRQIQGGAGVGGDDASERRGAWADRGASGRGAVQHGREGQPPGPLRPPAATPRPRRSAGPRPRGTHLASSSSGVSGHLAAKCAVTALDAAADGAPRRASHSATERRSSSRGAFAAPARAMARRGEREPPRHSARLPVRRRPLPVGGAAGRYSAGRGGAHAWPQRSRGARGGEPARADAAAPERPPRGLGGPGIEGLGPRVRSPRSHYQSETSWSCPKPASPGPLR